MNALIDFVLAICFGVKELCVVFISMIPMVELKGGIPVGLKLGMGYWEAFFWAFWGSSFVCIPLLLILGPLFTWAKKNKRIGGISARIEGVFARKAGKSDNNGANFAKIASVFLFSMLPLPGAGVWTASFIAVILGLTFGWAVLSIVAGNLVDGLVVLGLTRAIGKHNMDIILLVLFALVILFVIFFLYKVFKENPRDKTRI